MCIRDSLKGDTTNVDMTVTDMAAGMGIETDHMGVIRGDKESMPFDLKIKGDDQVVPTEESKMESNVVPKLVKDGSAKIGRDYIKFDGGLTSLDHRDEIMRKAAETNESDV